MLSFLAAILVIVVGVIHCAAYLLWHYERCRSGACGARLTSADVGPWLAEGLALLVAVLTWPLGLAGWTRARANVGRPVVLVHGWGLNGASMALIAARLRRDGRIVHAEAFTWRRKNLADAAAAVAERLRAAAATSGSSTVDVVAYGVGGVLVRSAAQAHGAWPLLGNVVTLASPHRGTALALLGWPAIRDLRPGSSFLDDLVHGEMLPTQTHVAAIASPFDAVVFPFDLAYWPGAFNVTVERVGHCSMLYSERVYALIAENLDVAPRIEAA
jgi:triacylglycerol esterase/lipase EstA (alpha/beta hydrolase family)